MKKRIINVLFLFMFLLLIGFIPDVWTISITETVPSSGYYAFGFDMTNGEITKWEIRVHNNGKINIYLMDDGNLSHFSQGNYISFETYFSMNHVNITFQAPYGDRFFFVMTSANKFSHTVTLTEIEKWVYITSPTSLASPADKLIYEPYLYSSNCCINWESSQISNSVDLILYKEDNQLEFIESDTPDDGNYIWEIPSGTHNGKDYQIKILDSYDSTIYDFTSYFSIYSQKSIMLLKPPKGSSIRQGQKTEICWECTSDIDLVNISLYKGNSYIKTLISDINATEMTFTWNVPNSLEGSNFNIKIVDSYNSSIYANSELFTIETPYSLELIVILVTLPVIGLIVGIGVYLFLRRRSHL